METQPGDLLNPNQPDPGDDSPDSPEDNSPDIPEDDGDEDAS